MLKLKSVTHNNTAQWTIKSANHLQMSLCTSSNNFSWTQASCKQSTTSSPVATLSEVFIQLVSFLISHAIKQTISFHLNTVSVNLKVCQNTIQEHHHIHTDRHRAMVLLRELSQEQHSSPYISNSND